MLFNNRSLLALAWPCTSGLWSSVFCNEEKGGKSGQRQNAQTEKQHIQGSYWQLFHAPVYMFLSLSSQHAVSNSVSCSICSKETLKHYLRGFSTASSHSILLMPPLSVSRRQKDHWISVTETCSNFVLFPHFSASFLVLPLFFYDLDKL